LAEFHQKGEKYKDKRGVEAKYTEEKKAEMS